MQNILNQKKDLHIIVEKGTFYYPAYKHYGKITNVCCDFCSKSNLDCCVGLDDKDLCLRCVELFVENDKNNNLPQMTDIYRYPQQQTNPHIITRMMQDSVRRNPQSSFMTTNMMQDSVRRNPQSSFMTTNMMQDSVRQLVHDASTLTFMMQNSTRPITRLDCDGDGDY
jgi:hypothetical protein